MVCDLAVPVCSVCWKRYVWEEDFRGAGYAPDCNCDEDTRAEEIADILEREEAGQ